MSFLISYQTLGVLIDGHDSEGRLILANGQLATVNVRLDGDTHRPEDKGRWHMEAAFGRCDVMSAPSTFVNPEEAGAWVKRTLEDRNRRSRPTVSDKAVEYRRQAKEFRTVARQISLSEARKPLLASAERLEALDEEEGRQAQASSHALRCGSSETAAYCTATLVCNRMETAQLCSLASPAKPGDHSRSLPAREIG